MKKIISKLCISIFILTCLTGCGDYNELNKMSIVTAIGIDKTNDKNQPYSVTLQIVNPSEVAGGAGTAATGKALSVLNIQEKGSNIVEAIRNASKVSSRLLFFGHTSLVIISEDIAKEGVYKVLDFFERDPKASSDTPILVARDRSAHSILSVVSSLEKIPALSDIGKVAHTQDILGEEFTTKVYEIIENLSIYGREATVTGIALNETNKKSSTQENSLQINTISPIIDGVGLFRNGKLTGWLDGKDGLAASIALNKTSSVHLTVPCEDNSFSLNLTNINSSLKATWQNGRPILTYSVKGRGALDETTCNLPFESAQDTMLLEKKAAEALKKQLENGIAQAQKAESDIFGFGEALRNKKPKKWKEIKQHWPAYFGNAEVHVTTDISIARTNMRNDSIHLIHGKGEND